MTAVDIFTTNFNSIMEQSKQADGTIKPPFMVRISRSLASAPELVKFLDINNDRAEYMGVTINVVSDFSVCQTYAEAFPNG